MHLSLNLIESHGASGVFRTAEHVFDDYFDIRRNPHTQELIISQIIACSGHFMVPGDFRSLKDAKFRIIFFKLLSRNTTLFRLCGRVQ